MEAWIANDTRATNGRPNTQAFSFGLPRTVRAGANRARIAKDRPHATISWVIGNEGEDSPLVLNRERTAIEGEPTLYVCENFACQQPVAGLAAAEELWERLE